MDGLDLLKKHWQNDQGFPKVDKHEIQLMLHKKSSSLLRWIFIISVIELFIGICLNVKFYFYDKPMMDAKPFVLEIFSEVVDVLLYLVTIYFVYCFFSAYRKIKNTTNTKVLLQSILHTRKTVNDYIKFNIYIVIYVLSLEAISRFLNTDMHDWNLALSFLYIVFLASVTFLFAWFLIYLIKKYYRFLYVRLVNKLDVNYEELERLEQTK